MAPLDWNEPLDAPEGSCFFWSETTVWAFEEDLNVTLYFETVGVGVSPLDDPQLETRLEGLGGVVVAAHEHLRLTLQNSPATLGVSVEDAALALANPEPGAFADATEITLYRDGDTLVRFPFTDLPGTEEYGVGVVLRPGGVLEIEDLRESVELGQGTAS